jgi:SAM-dependent methyltransferase
MQSWDSESYAKNAAFVHELADGVLAWLDALADEHILDLGCGDGQLTQRIPANVVGLDSSPAMIAAARARGVMAEQGSAEAMPFADRSFDAVFSNAALHWVHDQDAMMAEVHRVLKPAGRFVAEMGGQGNVAAIRVALTAVMMRYGYPDRETGVNYYPSVDGYRRRLERHGFEVERIELIPRPTPLPASGMEGWLRTFRRGVLEELPEPLRETVVKETTALLENVLRDEDGNWTADYSRLRFIARV